MDSKYQYYAGLFEKADKDRNKKEYYMASNEYLNSFHDGHVFVLSLMQSVSLNYADNFTAELKSVHIGGSFGFSVIQTDDGRVVVSLVGEGSNAEKLGIKQGTVITKWNALGKEAAISYISEDNAEKTINLRAPIRGREKEFL
jgi:carboxyl-terminal processing protease